MTFFNKNQEVIDLKLTRFGRGLLSRGAFRPVFYQFFDDDIIYDVSWSGITETQNDSEPRIKETIRLKTQHLTTGVENSFDHQSELIKEEKRGIFIELSRLADPLENERILKYPLASYNPGSQIAPSFSIKVLGAPLTGSLEYNHVSGVINNTPQLTIQPEYTFTVDRTGQTSESLPVVPGAFRNLMTDVIEFGDKSKIVLNKEDIVLDIEEHYTFFGPENFEIEMLKETSHGSGVYIQMFDKEEIFEFFDIRVDDRVDLQEIEEEDKNRNV